MNDALPEQLEVAMSKAWEILMNKSALVFIVLVSLLVLEVTVLYGRKSIDWTLQAVSNSWLLAYAEIEVIASPLSHSRFATLPYYSRPHRHHCNLEGYQGVPPDAEGRAQTPIAGRNHVGKRWVRNKGRLLILQVWLPWTCTILSRWLFEVMRRLYVIW